MGPRGGMWGGRRLARAWVWQRRRPLVSAPLRCKGEELYLVRLRCTPGANWPRARLMFSFHADEQLVAERCVWLYPALPGGAELLGWVAAPARATSLRAGFPDAELAADAAALHLHNVAERDVKCHPAANTPRWSTVSPPLPLARVVLPASLYELAGLVDWTELEIVDAPRDASHLRKLARAAVCVVDPRWVAAGGLSWPDLEAAAEAGCVIVDLETAALLLRQAGVAVGLKTHASPHGLLSARVEYGDFATRGFAQQDVWPYATLDRDGGFGMRVLRAGRAWKRYADETGFATLLSSETPWEQHHGDVLAAARPVGRGELLITDLPWLAAGRCGPLAAPRVARRMLRVQLGAPLADGLQYWNRWDEGDVIVRDLSEFARRYEPLRAVRWASDEEGVAHLGLTASPHGPARRHLLIQTGRIDAAGCHEGLPPEPLTLFCKWLAREARERTAWARRYLERNAVTWQFDTADGLKYVANFDSAQELAGLPTQGLRVRLATPTERQRVEAAPAGGVAGQGGSSTTGSSTTGSSAMVTLADDEGLWGDGAFEFQEHLHEMLVRWIEGFA